MFLLITCTSNLTKWNVYMPKTDDLVIGTIQSIFGNSWFADINSCYQGMLLGQDVFGRGSYPTTSEMKERLR